MDEERRTEQGRRRGIQGEEPPLPLPTVGMRTLGGARLGAYESGTSFPRACPSLAPLPALPCSFKCFSPLPLRPHCPSLILNLIPLIPKPRPSTPTLCLSPLTSPRSNG